MPHNQPCFASPLDVFPDTPNNDPLEEILAPTAGFFPPPEALGALQRETSSAVLVLQKGKAPSTRQRRKSTGPRPVGGNQPSLPPAIDVSLLLTPTQGKSFYPLLRACASSSTDPSSDQKHSVSEHTFVCNRTAFLWKFTLLHSSPSAQRCLCHL